MPRPSLFASLALALAPALALALAACGGSGSGSDGHRDSAPPSDTSLGDGAPADGDKAASCASTFGEDLAPGFTRFDGTILAVVPPNDQMCAAPNATHLVVQLVIDGKAYRMVVDVLSTQGSPDVLFDELDAPLPAPAWAPGVHAGASLDYPTTLAVHSAAFTAIPQHDLVAKITSELDVGANLSVFATVGTEPDSAHLVHRQGGHTDGAIVVAPDTAPHWLLMRFDEQLF